MSRATERILVAVVGLAASGCEAPAVVEPGYLSVEPDYAGSATCGTCHERQYDLWRGSHHDLAMQEATVATVLADFDDARLEHQGVVSTFSRRDDELWVRTDGPDGDLADYRVAYAFGVEPLQQYLIELAGGRLQALTIAWDTRPAAAGGQRWFHLYPDEEIPAGDALHWTGSLQNWNYMCAECHSTGLRRGYDPATDTYDTTWSEIDVACEACHGPGSRHVAWAEEVGSEAAAPPDGEAGSLGLVVRLGDLDEPVWSFDARGIARREPARTSHREVESCGRCHSRRSVIREPYVHGRPLLDTHRLALLTPDLYHPDGQILDEVYVYGSFVQSRMYAAGVTCGDCHDPHSGEPLVDGNALCARCHLATKYDATSHHRHAIEDTAATRCVACHMRSETYMVVDPRRDHSFRVPRPDLSLAIGTPDACADCHREASPEWVARRFEEWWPERAAAPHFGETLHAAAEAAPGAAAGLRRLTEDAAQSGIVRATALEALLDFADPSLPGLVERAARDSDPLLRMAAARALAAVDATGALTAGRSLLVDPVLAVRTEAARTLSALPPGQLSAADREALDAAVAELERSLLVNAERPESHIVLGAIRAQRGDLAAARDAYEVALALEPRSVAARVNLADLLRQEGDDGAAAALLRDALDIAPDDADVHHALGLALVRLGRADEALEALERAAELDPANLRYGYVHAVAAHSTGRVPLAIRRLEELHERWPADADVLVALINYHAGLGGFAEAELYARKLVELLPGDSRARELLERIRARR